MVTNRSKDLNDVARAWNAFGERDPMYAVLTYEGKQGNRWKPDEFFATGEREIEGMLLQVAASGAELRLEGRALDFGCGLGRLTQPLARRFREAHGVDIAQSMLEQARAFAAAQEQHCTFHLNTKDDLELFPDGYFDFICTLVTLHHVEPRYSAAYLKEMLRVLAPGGTLVAQLPAREKLGFRTRQVLKRGVPAGALYWYRRVRHGRHHATNPSEFEGMDVHGTPRAEVLRLLTEAGGRVLLTIRDDHSSNWISYRYIVTK